MHQILQDLQRLLFQYLRALVILATVAFVFYALFLSLTGAPYAVLLAGVAGLLEFIPAVGPFIAVLIIATVGLFSGYTHWLLLLLFVVVYRVAQDYVSAAAAVVSSGMRIHPLLIIFGAFWLAVSCRRDLPGIFFSIPLIAALRTSFSCDYGSRTALAVPMQPENPPPLALPLPPPYPYHRRTALTRRRRQA